MLLATGERVRQRSVETRDELTAQEAQVARLACDGLSNVEIGQRPFISQHTVSYHLCKVFSKLDITSRTQLDRVMPEGAGIRRDPQHKSRHGLLTTISLVTPATLQARRRRVGRVALELVRDSLPVSRTGGHLGGRFGALVDCSAAMGDRIGSGGQVAGWPMSRSGAACGAVTQLVPALFRDLDLR